MLRAQDNTSTDRLVNERPGPRYRPRDINRQLLRHPRMPRLDMHARPDDNSRHRAISSSKPELRMKTRPRALLLVLPDAERVLRRRPLRSLVQLVWPQPERVQHAEPDRPPDRRVRPEPGPEHVPPAVQPDPLPHRPVHDQEWRGPGRRLPDPANRVPLTSQRLPRGHHHREVQGQAPG